MGLFSAHGRLPQPAGDKPAIRLHLPDTLAQLTHRFGGMPARLGLVARAAIQNTATKLTAGVRLVRLVTIAATNDARVVAVLLLLAAIALGLEMAASFHVI